MRFRTFSERYVFRRDLLGRNDSGTITAVNKIFHDEVEAGRYKERWQLAFDKKTIADVLGALQECVRKPVADLGRVLDLGAGDGVMIWSVTTAGKTAFPVAQDISKAMLDQIPSLEPGSRSQIRRVKSDACLLPFKGGSFDTVIANAIFHHVPSPLRTAKEALRILSPGGRLFVTGEPTHSCNLIGGTLKAVPVFMLDIFRAVLRRKRSHTKRFAKKHPPDVYAFPPGELVQCMQGAGFDTVRLATTGLASTVFRTVVGPWVVFALCPRLGRRVEDHIYRFLQIVDNRLLNRLLPLSLKSSIRLSATRPVCRGYATR